MEDMQVPRLEKKLLIRSSGSACRDGAIPTSSPTSITENYAEIFSGFASSFSIPMLVLPEAMDGYEDELTEFQSSDLNYSEIFGPIDAGAFSLSYEELLLMEMGLKEEARVHEETNACKVLEFLGELPAGGDVAFSKFHQISSNLDKEQLNNFGRVTGQQSCTSNCPPELDAKASSSTNVAKYDNFKLPRTDDQIVHGDVIEEKEAGRQAYSLNSTSSCDSSFSDLAFLTINLRTQPSKVPPPLRSPPILDSKQREFKSEEEAFNLSYKNCPRTRHALKETVKSVSSICSDESINTISTAEASAAAMVEAMEQAQASLKSAKELMERKREWPRQNFKHKTKKESKTSVISGDFEKKERSLKWKIEEQFYELVGSDNLIRSRLNEEHKNSNENTEKELFGKQWRQRCSRDGDDKEDDNKVEKFDEGEKVSLGVQLNSNIITDEEEIVSTIEASSMADFENEQGTCPTVPISETGISIIVNNVNSIRHDINESELEAMNACEKNIVLEELDGGKAMEETSELGTETNLLASEVEFECTTPSLKVKNCNLISEITLKNKYYEAKVSNSQNVVRKDSELEAIVKPHQQENLSFRDIDEDSRLDVRKKNETLTLEKVQAEKKAMGLSFQNFRVQNSENVQQMDKERAREREKDMISVRLHELKEKPENVLLEKDHGDITNKLSSEVLEKHEKAMNEAKLRAERASVERAMTEARARAVERALFEREKGNNDIIRPTSVVHDAPICVKLVSEGREAESPLRCKAREERHQRIVERGAKALAEKNFRDNLAHMEQAERNRISETLDAEVRRWSNGKEGNLRALLSTLQYILGHDSGWQPIPLTEVITAAACKKVYRKATLYVHPDKLQQRGATIQHKYICEKVFDLLKDAWNKFNSEGR